MLIKWDWLSSINCVDVCREKSKAIVHLIPERGLGKDALARMTALKEYTALGSGFAIANADLEIFEDRRFTWERTIWSHRCTRT